MLLQSTSSSCPSVSKVTPTLTPQWKPTSQVADDRNAPLDPCAAVWVTLHHLPHPDSFDEALLLCPDSPETWVAWVPNYGEIVLNQADFYR